ncbi:MAG TPA: pilus assembly protein N-terminal domain-containing protein [Candidatus Binataceae bacterium]|nr:pilus assembly protein N-terminal domain-containing protein [Candidatus Binataceae bacterium]
MMRGQKLIAALLFGTLPLIALTAHRAVSDDTTAVKVPITLNTGETYVIKDLDSSATPAIRVLDNPHALVIHSEVPGELTVQGAEAGEWQIHTTSTGGGSITYDVAVNDVPSPIKPAVKSAAPASAPAASGALDRGAGPIAGTTSTAAKSGAVLAATAPPASTPPVMTAAASTSTLTPVAAPAMAPAPAALPAARYPATSAASGSAPPTVMAETAPSIPGSGGAPNGVMASQAPSLQGPPVKFRTDPLAPAPLASEAPNGVQRRNYLPDYSVDLMADTSEIYDFPTRITRISIADSNIADIQVINPFQINLIGHQPGFTTLAVWDSRGHYLQREVRVDRDSKEQVMLNVIVAELDRSRLENQGVNYSVALTHLGLSIVGLPGQVATPYSPQSQIIAQATAGVGAVATSAPSGVIPNGGSLINMLLSQNVTYGIAGQNNNVNSAAFFQFLEQHELGKILAQPHLLANSGEKAQFLSGGEIPIVIAQALNTSIVFKQFGTSVVFVPTVVGSDDIELAVKPEVSQPDYAHGVQLFGFTVPAFVTRRAETFVRLHNQQTLIIAGLILDTKVETVDKVPYLGDIPYVSGLFRNTSYSDQKTDLVMSVTPQIVAPLPSNGEVSLPVDRGPLTSDEIRTERVYPSDASRPRF